MLTHSADLARLIREKYTVYETGPNRFESYAASFLIGPTVDSDGQALSFNHEKVHLHGFLSAGTKQVFAEIYADSDAGQSGQERWLSQHCVLTTEQSVERSDIPKLILHHYSKFLNLLVSGRDSMEEEFMKFSRTERFIRKCEIFYARMARRGREIPKESIKSLEECLYESYKSISGAIEMARRVNAVLDLFNIRETGIKVVIAVSELLGLPVRVRGERKLSPRAEKYAEMPQRDTPLNLFLNPLKASMINDLYPLDLSDSTLGITGVQAREGDPLESTSYGKPTLSAAQVALGRLKLERNGDTLVIQADGTWLALISKEGHKTTYIGYNSDFKVSGDAKPSAPITAWLDKGKIIRLKQGGGGGDDVVKIMEFE